MKKILVFVLGFLSIVSCADKYADEFGEIRAKIDEVNHMLDKMCKEANANMAALQEIVKALETNDYITSIYPLVENGVEVGYSISFFKGKVITIYHGRDGIDGTDGSDGADGKPGTDGSNGIDGQSIQIGVKQANDGNWYWTINGNWMRDADGNKVRANPLDGQDGEDGEDGKDGEDGEDGKDGANGLDGKPGQDGEDGKDGEDGTDGEDGQNGKPGTDGKDGITPQMKIEDGYWYISVDNGQTWTQYGKATGDDGLPGPDAVTPEIMISSVTWDEHNAYFLLKSGETITLPLKRPFGIQMEQTKDILIAAGGTIYIPYTIIGVDEDTEIYCICDGGWKADVVEVNFFSGNIAVKAPYPFKDGKVLVMAQNAAHDLVMQSLTFKEMTTELE